MTSTINPIIPELLFAVTDQNVIIPLKTVEIARLPHCIKVTTEIAEESPKPHSTANHEHYFARLYFELDGKLDRTNVFTELKAAQDYVTKELTEQIEHQREVLARLEADLEEHLAAAA